MLGGSAATALLLGLSKEYVVDADADAGLCNYPVGGHASPAAAIPPWTAALSSAPSSRKPPKKANNKTRSACQRS